LWHYAAADAEMVRFYLELELNHMKNIKKILLALLAVALCAAMAVSVMAVESTFIPSNDLEVVSAVAGGEDVKDKITVTSGSADEDLLKQLYDALSDGSMKLPVEGEFAYVDMFALGMAEDLSDVTVELALESIPEGSLAGYVYVDEEWKQIENVTYANGNVSFSMAQSGPVVLVELPKVITGTKHQETTTVVDTPGSMGRRGFVPSITYKEAPFVVTISSNMEYDLTTQYKECLVVTTLMQAEEKTTDIQQESRDLLQEVYEKLADGSMTLPLEENYVIRELVDIDFKYEACQCSETHGDKCATLAEDGKTITIDFNLGVDEDTEIVVMTYVDGEWKAVESVVNNGDGTITCIFEDLCPVAFAVIED